MPTTVHAGRRLATAIAFSTASAAFAGSAAQAAPVPATVVDLSNGAKPVLTVATPDLALRAVTADRRLRALSRGRRVSLQLRRDGTISRLVPEAGRARSVSFAARVQRTGRGRALLEATPRLTVDVDVRDRIRRSGALI